LASAERPSFNPLQGGYGREYRKAGTHQGQDRPGHQFIPRGWFDLATKHGPRSEDESIRADPNAFNPGCPLDYRYQWWLARRPRTDFTAVGINGQFVHIYPAADALVAQISDWGDWRHGNFLECESLRAHDAMVMAAAVRHRRH
jgi:hypothetical protein